MDTDTIFALSTIFGKSGVAVIRISGKEAFQTISHFKITKNIAPRTATLVTLYDSDNFPIDKSLIIYFQAPHSFTGEDIVELHIHGSKAVITTILQELGNAFRLAKPGEFSQRAFQNNKLDLTQAEGLSDLIEAETKMQARQALRQISGELENLYNQWRENLIANMANIEAYLDFPDDDIPEGTFTQVQQKVQLLLEEMQKHLKDDNRGEKLRNGFYISIVGAPNTGKSTLFNYLVQQDMAIISDIAGTTRDIIETTIDLDGYPVVISDTAGIHDTLDPIELEGILRAKKRKQQSDLTLALFSIEDLHNLDKHTKSLIDANTICIASKADHFEQGVEIYVEDKKFLPISIHKKTGLDNLVRIIKNTVLNQLTPSSTPVITRERHRKAITIAAEHLIRYNVEKDMVLGAENLRMAANTLGEITGHIKIDDVLDQLFSKFCIGK